MTMMKYFIIFHIAVAAYASNITQNFHITKRTGDGSETVQGEIILQENTDIEWFCDSHVPAKWTTQGSFSFWSEPHVTRHPEGFENELTAKAVQSLTGVLACEPDPKTEGNANMSAEVYLYVNGSSAFANNKSQSIDLNEAVGQMDYDLKLIPCRTTLPSLLPNLAATDKSGKHLNVGNAKFNPRKGFTLTRNVVPGQVYTCCVREECVSYRVSAESFWVKPKTQNVYAFTKTPVVLECQGSNALKVEVTSGRFNANLSIYTEAISTFKSGPTMSKRVVIQDVNLEIIIQCIDNNQRQTHQWKIVPPLLQAHMLNQSVRYFQQNHAFDCVSTSDTLYSRNMLCESFNHCQMKERCVQTDALCESFVKKSTPCKTADCVALADPFSNGIFECGTESSKYTLVYFTGLDRKIYDARQENLIPSNALVRIEEFNSPFYQGLDEFLIIYCSHALFTLAKGASFRVQFQNGTDRELFEDEELELTEEEQKVLDELIFRDVTTISLKFRPVPEMSRVTCSAPKRREMGFVTVSRPLDVIEAKLPEISHWQYEKIIFTNDVPPVLINCNATGQPDPYIFWSKIVSHPNDSSGLMDNPLHKFLSNGSVLTFSEIDESVAGDYICHAKNGMGYVNKSINVRIQEPVDKSSNTSAWIIAVILSCVIFGTLCLVMLYRRRNNKLKNIVQMLTEKEVDDFFKGRSSGLVRNYSQKHATELVNQLPYNNLYEIPEDKLQYSQKQVIGEGQFGIVYQGILNSSKPVAIKTSKDCDKKSFQNLLLEIKVMIHVGFHPCVVEFLGAITNNIKQMDVFVVVELCEKGDLHSFLKSKKPIGNHEEQSSDWYENTKLSDSDYYNPDKFDIDLKQMLTWCNQICMGVDHLAKRKIVHGDIACRNILLDANYCAKIADFGLSCQVSNYSEYVSIGEKALPWRWMALEALEGNKFSYWSDIWSVGITMWEIFNYGETPYPGYSWNTDFVEILRSGLRLAKPPACPQELYDEVLWKTWDSVPRERITLGEMQNNLERKLAKLKQISKTQIN